MPEVRDILDAFGKLSRRARWFGAIGSLVLHGIVVLALRSGAPAPAPFEFKMPSEVEFGIADAVPMQQPPAPAPASSGASSSSGASGDGPGREGPDLDAGVPFDAGQRRRRHRDAGAPGIGPGAGDVDAGPNGLGEGVAAYAPPGASLSLRLDLAAIRETLYASNVRRLLAAIPDWQFVIDGSGISPLDDLDRLMLASPDLRREHMVMAGHYQGDAARVRDAVAAIASAHGQSAAWTDEGGIAVAPWHDADDTERSVALVGESEFIITRTDDVARVVAVAQAMAERARREGAQGEGVLVMREHEVLSLEIEGARNYLAAMPMPGVGEVVVPSRARLSVQRMETTTTVIVSAEATYDTPDQASAAVTFWSAYRDDTLRRLGPVFGVIAGGPLRALTIRADGARVLAETRVARDIGQLALDYATAWFQSLGERMRQQGIAVPVGSPPREPPRPTEAEPPLPDMPSLDEPGPPERP